MEGPNGGGGGGGGGGPAPFLVKTYEMIDDPSTNDVVAWADEGASFVVWDPPEFAARLLPTYFKHNNFSSFIRQLNTYGFRKIDPERWEFANDNFIKGKKHLLKSIYRRKPIHSHSQPPAGPLPEAERAALEEEIDRLTRERTGLQNELWRFQQQQSGTEIQIGDIERRIQYMEQRQHKMLTFLQKATANPRFMDNLIKMANGLPGPTAMSVPSPGLPGLPDPSPVTDSLHKKRRLPTGEDMQYSPELMESCNNNNNFTNNNSSSLYEDHCSSSSSGRTDFSIINQSFDKLKLGLCPAMAAMSTHSSNEEDDNVGPHVRISDTSLCPLKCTELAGDGPLSSHLDLTLASFPSMEMAMGRDLNIANMSAVYERGEDTNGTGIRSENRNGTENGTGIRSENRSETENGSGIISENRSGTENGIGNEKKVGSQNGSGGLQEEAVERGEPVGPPARINDVFWEQFLTERPGCDNEEASSGLRSNANPSPSGESLSQEGKEMENLKL